MTTTAEDIEDLAAMLESVVNYLHVSGPDEDHEPGTQRDECDDPFCQKATRLLKRGDERA